MAARITDCKEWFQIWFNEKQSILDTMLENMRADISAGYNFFGACITGQKEDFLRYKEDFENTMDLFRTMTESEINHWCFYDMKKRGVIE